MRRVAILTIAFVCVLICASRQASSGDSSPAEETALEQLRKSYLALVKEDIDSWSKEDLESKIKEVQISLADKKAVKFLQEAEQTLRRLIDEFPETPSARAAENMLSTQHPEFGPRFRVHGGFGRFGHQERPKEKE